jgi:hypothetical protein
LWLLFKRYLIWIPPGYCDVFSLFSSIWRRKCGLCFNSGDSPLRHLSFTVTESFDVRSLIGLQRHCWRHSQSSALLHPSFLFSNTSCLFLRCIQLFLSNFSLFSLFTFSILYFFSIVLYSLFVFHLSPPHTHLSIRSLCFNWCLWFLFCLL